MSESFIEPDQKGDRGEGSDSGKFVAVGEKSTSKRSDFLMIGIAIALVLAIIPTSVVASSAAGGGEGENIIHRFGLVADGANLVTINQAEIIDKIEGGWVGQMAGVAWGAPTEFRYRGEIVPDPDVPSWSPDMINNSFGQDDIYVEIPFIDAMRDHGVNCSWTIFGNYFRDTSFQLWHANLAARTNLRNGIPAPDSGHYSNNAHCDDIDWQIEADFVGQMTPSQVNTAIERAWCAGHVMNYGDGVYGGVFMAAMHARAFTAASIDEIIEAGRQAVPLGSKYRQVIEDVIAWEKQGNTWEQTWNLLENKWGDDDRCPHGVNKDFNIDAKLNGAYVLIGLLYGNGDFEQSVRISMRCGQDSDCNPSSVGGILGNYYGLSGIPDKWKSALDRTGTNFSRTDYNFDEVVNLNLCLAREVLQMNGGWISGNVWNIPDQGAIRPPILEQWPESADAMPSLSASAGTQSGRTVTFTASATDSDGIKAYQWYFGDLTYADGANVTHTYPQDGTYEAIVYVTDGIGNTAWKAVQVSCGVTPPASFLPIVAGVVVVAAALVGLLYYIKKRRGGGISNSDDEKVRNQEIIVLIGILLVVGGLFLPWAHWESYGDAPAGSTTGLETLDGGIDGWLFLLFGFFAGYLSLKKLGGLSPLFIAIFGLLILLGGSLNIDAPWGFAPPELPSLGNFVSPGAGLYAVLIGGFVILASGIFSLTQKWGTLY